MRKLTPEEVAERILPIEGWPGFTGSFADGQRRIVAGIQRDLDREQEKHPIISEIMSERAKQEEMWGIENDDLHSEECWSAIVTQELGQACFHDDNSATFRKQMIKVAAVAVAAIEAIDRAKGVA